MDDDLEKLIALVEGSPTAQAHYHKERERVLREAAAIGKAEKERSNWRRGYDTLIQELQVLMQDPVRNRTKIQENDL